MDTLTIWGSIELSMPLRNDLGQSRERKSSERVFPPPLLLANLIAFWLVDESKNDNWASWWVNAADKLTCVHINIFLLCAGTRADMNVHMHILPMWCCLVVIYNNWICCQIILYKYTDSWVHKRISSWKPSKIAEVVGWILIHPNS